MQQTITHSKKKNPKIWRLLVWEKVQRKREGHAPSFKSSPKNTPTTRTFREKNQLHQNAMKSLLAETWGGFFYFFYFAGNLAPESVKSHLVAAVGYARRQRADSWTGVTSATSRTRKQRQRCSRHRAKASSREQRLNDRHARLFTACNRSSQRTSGEWKPVWTRYVAWQLCKSISCVQLLHRRHPQTHKIWKCHKHKRCCHGVLAGVSVYSRVGCFKRFSRRQGRFCHNKMFYLPYHTQ